MQQQKKKKMKIKTTVMKKNIYHFELLIFM